LTSFDREALANLDDYSSISLSSQTMAADSLDGSAKAARCTRFPCSIGVRDDVAANLPVFDHGLDLKRGSRRRSRAAARIGLTALHEHLAANGTTSTTFVSHFHVTTFFFTFRSPGIISVYLNVTSRMTF
jgi:hypothetical protein